MSETRDNGLIGSLFTGYGGLDLGVMAALGGPMDVAWTSDIEPGPTAIEERHAPACGCPPNLGDITRIDTSTLRGIDVVCGGSPCQSMSLAGLRAGMHSGTRSGLWSYQTDVVAAVRPALMVWENVSGALSATASSREDLAEADRRAAALGAAGLCACETPSINPPTGFTPPDPDAEGSRPLAVELREFLKGDAARLAAIRCSKCGRPPYQMRAGHALADGERLDGAHTAPTIRALGRVLGDLANLGYDAVWRGIEAADVGAPHRRLRIFVAAWPHDPGTARTSANPRLARLAQLPPMRPDGLPWAVWDAGRDVWTEPADDLFGERGVFMDAWPRSGVMAAGAVYRAPTSAGVGGGPALRATPNTMDGMPPHADVEALRAVGRDDIRALPTPNASDADKHGPSDADRLRASPSKKSIHLCDEIASGVAVLSTPRATDGVKGGPHQSFGAGGTPLAAQAAMLPTPSALYDSEKAGTPADARRRRDRGAQLGLADMVNLLDGHA
ncbi:DNA cytosine methyltransferase [Bifidobacterium myosotis]|uniref:DNA cytosine methyltransferase n=1 Tax=Bifidobacterium myosotis TaxID=1630166 RepID=A0A5M9ZHE6_9BIFI|nr:DNA cytosine methyltransferase [Bifidobacterium myosotis]KAA8826928.1 DNA cytosine methyltransferase [Bifidobacterium myosotis]